MFKKIFEVVKSDQPLEVYGTSREGAAFGGTNATEINATQTPVAWCELTEYKIFGKVRAIPSRQSIKQITATMEIYGDE